MISFHAFRRRATAFTELLSQPSTYRASRERQLDDAQ